jgi:MPBQ/MSBQ methyltransferase
VGPLTGQPIESEREEIRRHLEREYAGVFGPAEIEFHLNSHVGDAFADYACQVVSVTTPPGSRILDVGAGYGSFVMLARARGFQAIGTEIAPFEVSCSRRRLARERPGDNPEQVFLDQGIFHTALDGARFEAVTFWNVLEHIDDIGPVIQRAAGLLAPGGAIYVVCPNYAAWRNEAHYQVPWRPFLSREAAVRRLREHGKDPRFFETSVFQRTNWGVMAEMRRNGLQLFDRLNQKHMTLGRLGTEPRLFCDFYNPARAAVELAARKPE